MAGSVTGNIGSENVTLRNMATEDTLDAILDVLSRNKIVDNNTDKSTRRRIEGAANAVKSTASSMKDVAEIFKGVGTGAYKIVRGLESNIENVSYTFSTIAGELRKESSVLAKFFGFASESVAMIQEQQNAYSRMVQVGGATVEEFSKLGVQATELGTDVRGVTELVDKFGFSLKIGSTSVSGGLKNLRNVFKEVTPDLMNQFGRLGIAPQRVTEQMLLAAEASGGFGDVLKRYGNDYKGFGQSMLRSTRELNIFATAIGSNSRAMMEEMAKANQQITNRLFMRTLNDGEKTAVNFLQSLTGSADIAIAVMKSLKGEATSQEAAMFQALKGFTGMNNELEDFMSLLSQGKDAEEALTKSGLLSFAKNLPEEQLQRLRQDVDAQRIAGNAEQAKFLEQQLLFITGLRDAKPEELKRIVSNLKDNLTPDGKTLDSFTQLQNNQIKLAHTTAGVNRQLNRLGLAIATSSLKLADLGLEAGGNTLESARKYFNQMLSSYGIDISIPDDIMNKGINEMEAYVEKFLNVSLGKAVADSNTASNAGPSNQSASSRLTVDRRTASGENRQIDVTETVNNDLIKKLTEALKVTDNQAGTLILGAMLQRQLKTTGGATSDPNLIPSGNPRESALGFKVKELEGKNLDESVKLTKDAIVNSLMNDFGLKKDQFNIIDEKTNNGESLVKVQIIDPTVSQSLRNDAQNILKQYQENSARTQVRADTAAPADASGGSAGNVVVPMAGTVNNNVSIVSFVKPDWWDGAMKTANEGTMTAVKNLESAFSRLTDILKQNLQK